jgi:PAS domain S-box-containing protein
MAKTVNLEAITHKSILEAFDASNEPIAITDAQLDSGVSLIYVNPAFCRETLYTKEELLGENPRILQGEKSNKELLGTLKEKLKTEGVFEGQTTNYKKDGSEYIVNWTISPLKDRYGKVLAYISFHKIITKEVTAELQNMVFEEVLENLPSMIIVTDLQANIIYVNKTFLQNLQYSKRELVGKNARILKSGKQSDKYYKNMWEKLTTKGCFDGVFISAKKDGTLFYDKKTITLLKDRSGVAQYYIGVSHDITQLTLALKKQKQALQEQ